MVEEHLELLSLADTHLGYEALATIIFKLKNLVSLPKVSGLGHHHVQAREPCLSAKGIRTWPPSSSSSRTSSLCQRYQDLATIMFKLENLVSLPKVSGLGHHHLQAQEPRLSAKGIRTWPPSSSSSRTSSLCQRYQEVMKSPLAK
jgi:hypothetical protein